MVAQTQKRPAPVLLRQALGRGALMAVGVVFAVGTAWMASADRRQGSAADVQQNAPVTWAWEGTGSDTTGAVDVETTGERIVGWSAPCPVSVVMTPWNDGTAGEDDELGTGKVGASTMTLAAGGYFFSVEGACDWVVRVNPA